MKSFSAALNSSKRYLIPCIAALAVLLCALALTPSLTHGQSGAEIMLENRSHWDIYHLYLSPSDDDHWGPDQLGKKVVKSGTTFTLNGIPCDDYDIKIVDEDGDSCVIENVNMCKDHTHWTLTDKDLLKCESAGN
jgi:hypothetical protein